LVFNGDCQWLWFLMGITFSWSYNGLCVSIWEGNDEHK
jgi:hypothetical protein